MLQNYLKVAIRTLIKHRLHTGINMLSLSIGIAAGIIILMFIHEELTFDSHHSKVDNIYRLILEEEYEGEQFINSVTPLVLADELRQNIPDIVQVTQYHPTNSIVRIDGQSFNESIHLAGSGFFEIFDFEIVSGSLITIFQNRSDLVLSKASAEKYFGQNDPIGQLLNVQLGDTYYPMTVKAVVTQPSNSSFRFGILISNLNNDKLFRDGLLQSWYNVITDTYILSESPQEEIEAKLPNLVRKSLGEDYEEGAYILSLQPFKDIHLNSEVPVGNVAISDARYIYILSFIGLFIILLGSINFVTLSIGSATYRAKEVGVRKVSGAIKSQLSTQFLCESLVTSLLSGCCGLFLAFIVLPLFNQLAGSHIQITWSVILVAILVILIVIIGLGAGAYPALVLSSFKPVTVLKGNVSIGKGKQNFRKVMVISQFVLAILLVSTTLIMERQLNFLQNKSLGYDKESIIMVPINAPFKGGLFSTIESAHQSALLLKRELENNPNVNSSSIAYQKFGDSDWINVGFVDQSDQYRNLKHTIVDFDFIGTMGLEVVAGRSFDSKISSDASTAIMINEAAARYFGWDNPLDSKLEGKRFGNHQIIGVVKDFNYQSLHGKVEPLVITINPELVIRGAGDISIDNAIAPTLHVKISQQNIALVLAEMQSSWEKLFPNEPFVFDFLDDKLKAQYKQEESLRQIVSYSTILALIIGALGLFGLVTLAINGRIKEIGIRKVLGASVVNLFYILSKEYVFMIILALLVSIPFSIYFMSNWLETFEYRISIPFSVFLTAGIVVIGISIATISYNVWKASIRQPVETLKWE